MFISGLFESGALPVLQASAQFAARRQEVIAHNIANISTPGFKQRDLSIPAFQEALATAVEQRRRETGGAHGALRFPGTREVQMTAGGNLSVKPTTPSGGILYHDRNDRDLERLMQDLAENTAAFRVATDLLKSRMDMMNLAIRERF